MYFMSINKIKPDVETGRINEALIAHRAWVKQQLAEGKIVQAGKWGDQGGMIVIKAGTGEEADKIVGEDPLAKTGLITFETAELHAAVAFK